MRWRWLVLIAIVILGALGAAWLFQRGYLGTAQPKTESPAPSHSHASMPAPAQPASLEEAEITIPPESLARIRLEYGEVTVGVVTAEVRVPGTVQPNAYREVRVTPLVGGVVTQVFSELGQTVKRGQPMVQIFSRDLAEAQTTLVTYTVELEVEHKKLLRTQELVRLGAASREELEAVEGSHQVHGAHVDESRQRLLLLGLNEAQIDGVIAGRQVSSSVAVPAPMDGVVIARSVNPGQVVATGQELFTVTDLSSVWVEGNLIENDFAVVRTGSRARITTLAYPGRVYTGAVEYIDPRVDPQTRTAKVRVVVDNAGLALRLGMYMDLLFSTAGSARVPVAPKGAIQPLGVSSVAFVPAEEGRFVIRTIRTGEETSGGVRVLEGLKPGERVVTEGSVLLRAEALRQRPQ